MDTGSKYCVDFMSLKQSQFTAISYEYSSHVQLRNEVQLRIHNDKFSLCIKLSI